MKAALAGIELHYLVQEFQQLIGARLETIYQPEPEDFYLVFHVPSQGKKMLRLVIGKCCYLTDERPTGIQPAPFCLFMRKHLESAKVKAIEQREGERIIEFSFDRDGKRSLFVELFGKGNLVLCDSHAAIMGALHYQKFKDREIVPKALYKYPHLPINPYSCTSEEIGQLVKKTTLSLVKCLATEAGLGGTYAEEVCLRAGVEKNSLPLSLDAGQIKKVAAVLKELTATKPQPQLIFQENEILAASPFSLELFRSHASRPCPTLSEAIGEFFTTSHQQAKKQSSKEKERDRLVRLLAIQEENLASLKAKEQDERSKGDIIFAHYPELQSLLQGIQQVVREKGWNEAESVAAANKNMRRMNLKDKTITLELD